MRRNTRIGLVLALVAAGLCIPASAQQGTDATPTPKAQQVPLSGRSSLGTVQAQQTTTNNPNPNSVDTITSTIQVTGDYQGSKLSPAASGVLSLTIQDAIRRGLMYNLGDVASSAASRQARAQRLAALSQMLPNITASIAESGAKVNLETQGLTPDVFKGIPSGGSSFKLPNTVGPYHYYSALANASESLSMTSFYNVRSAALAARAAELNAQQARELIVLAVGGTYLRVLAIKASVVSEEGQMKQAQATYEQTARSYEAGLKTIIDNNKSLIQYRTEQERLSSLDNDMFQEKMSLARLIGLLPGQQIDLQEDLPAQVPGSLALDEALRTAMMDRADLKAARQQLNAALASRRASRSEYFPSLSIKGDYGVEGINPSDGGTSVFQGSATLSIPIFNGGSTRSDIEQADAAITQRKAEYDDQVGTVELQVRQAYQNVQVSKQQVKVAQENRDLAHQTLTQSLDRYQAGVTTSVEVVQSQETLALAESDYINGLFSLNLSRISLAQAIGEAEKFVPNMLSKGN